MISISELKKKALTILRNNWLKSILIILLFILIALGMSTVLSCIFMIISIGIRSILSIFIKNISIVINISQRIHIILSFLSILFIFPLTIGYINYFLMFAKHQKPTISILFDGYKKAFGNSITANLLIGLFTFLWSLLLIVPGIIKSISYSMTLYIIADNPKISAISAINQSKKMMNGHKLKYFLLELSFIGWHILSIFTCGIGYAWLFPYMETSKAYFYLTIKNEFDEETSESIILEEF